MNNIKYKKVAILFSDFGPYHVVRIEALSKHLSNINRSLLSFRFSEKSNDYSWKPLVPEDVPVITLASKQPISVFQSILVSIKFVYHLYKCNIDVVFLPSYSPLPNFCCFLGAKILGCHTVLMIDSWDATEIEGTFRRFIKKFLIKNFDAALVAGNPQKLYVCKYGQHPSKVFLGYDVVDIDYFRNEAFHWRSLKKLEPHKVPFSNLPTRFFLNLGRFLPKKNLDSLIKAYALLLNRNPDTNISLVLVGEGSEETNLRRLAKELNIITREGLDLYLSHPFDKPSIIFFSFQQLQITPLFFTLCEAFILPSLYEEWGLVINESLACSTPVIVSEKVGCSTDLVFHGINGFIFDPHSVESLFFHMQEFILDPQLTHKLSHNCEKYISKWSPDFFAENSLSAINSIFNYL